MWRHQSILIVRNFRQNNIPNLKSLLKPLMTILVGNTNEKQRARFFFLTVLAGVILLWPRHDFLPFLIQGDIGRDLYAYDRTLNGAIPYRDYYYTYGPLMPYYYAFYLKVFGVHLTSILIGKIILNLFAGVLVYLTLATYIWPIMAFLASSWFWSFGPDFTHTFNHTGNTLTTTLLLFLLSFYCRNQKSALIFPIALILLVSLLIKISTGVALFVATAIVLVFIHFQRGSSGDQKKRLIKDLLILAVFFFVGVGIYVILFRGLPNYYLFQCLPIAPGYQQWNAASVGILLKTFWAELINQMTGRHPLFRMFSVSYFDSVWHFRILFGALLFITLAYLTALLRGMRRNTERHATYLFPTVMLVIALFLGHEFLLTGTFYGIWPACIVLIMLSFYAINSGIERMTFLVRVVVLAVLVVTMCLEVGGRYLYRDDITRTPGRLMCDPRLGIYVKNSPQWINTVEKTTAALKMSLGKNEAFMAIPYDPLYYYLLARAAPVPETIFFDFLNITRQQEERIIYDLERKQCNYVLLSNRISSAEQGLGEFGTSYCPLLFAYIRNNFESIAEFGDWRQMPQWIDGHATRIYRRIARPDGNTKR